MVKPSIKSIQKLGLPQDWKYNIYLTDNKKIECDCIAGSMGRNCRHKKYFEQILKQ